MVKKTHATTRMLAIETSGRSGSLALLEGRDGEVQLRVSDELSTDERTARALAPALRRLLNSADWSADSVGVVAVAIGPGSFTGLRIGVTTAKTFAYAVGAEVVGVDTMSVLAEPVPVAQRLWTVIDAQRGELFAASFLPDPTSLGRESATWTNERATHIAKPEQWIAQLTAGDVVTGPFAGSLRERLPDEVSVAASTLWQPHARCVADVGWRAFAGGQRDDLWQLVPNYYRRSAAEEKADQPNR